MSDIHKRHRSAFANKGKLRCTESIKIDRFKIDRSVQPLCSGRLRKMSATRIKNSERVMQQHPRLFARTRPSGRISSAAKIFASANATAVECILVDYSAGGACLQLKAFIALPDRFDVLYGTTRKHCRVVWKRGLRMGVAF
jgi:hypothetical protein